MHALLDQKARYYRITSSDGNGLTHLINVRKHKFSQIATKARTISLLIQPKRQRTGIKAAEHEHDFLRAG